MAPAAYYAHLLAARARCFMREESTTASSGSSGGGSAASTAGGRTAAGRTEKFIRQFKNAREELNEVMYFI